MQSVQSRPGFELVSPCPFSTTIMTTPRAPRWEYLVAFILVLEANFLWQFVECIGDYRRRKVNYSLEYFVFLFFVELVSYTSEYFRVYHSNEFFLLIILFYSLSFFWLSSTYQSFYKYIWGFKKILFLITWCRSSVSVNCWVLLRYSVFRIWLLFLLLTPFTCFLLLSAESCKRIKERDKDTFQIKLYFTN